MNPMEIVLDLTQYQAEVLRLVAEQTEKTVEELILSFFSNKVQCTKPLCERK